MNLVQPTDIKNDKRRKKKPKFFFKIQNLIIWRNCAHGTKTLLKFMNMYFNTFWTPKYFFTLISHSKLWNRNVIEKTMDSFLVLKKRMICSFIFIDFSSVSYFFKLVSYAFLFSNWVRIEEQYTNYIFCQTFLFF